MKYRLVALVLSLVISQMVCGADTQEKTLAVERVEALPFDNVLPFPGALAVAADGSIAAHISTSGEIVIWDISKIKAIETIAGDATPEKRPSAIAISPDGNLIAIGYLDSRLALWSRLEKRPLREFYGHAGKISALAFSPDGQMLASGAMDGTAQLWEVATGKRLHVFDSMTNEDGMSGNPVSVGFSGNGQALIVNDWHHHNYDDWRSVTIWDIKEGTEISTVNTTPTTDGTVRTGQALGGKGWLLAHANDWSDHKGLTVKRLDQCESPRQLPFDGYADTVAADPLGRWIAAKWSETHHWDQITFFDANNGKKTYAITFPKKSIALVPHPDGHSVFALITTDTGSTPYSDEVFGFDRSAQTATGSSNLYRVQVPEPLWRSAPLNVKKDATHCAPTEAVRRQQDFKLPEKPLELTVIAKLVPTKEMTANPNNPLYPPSDLYFNKDGNLYARYASFNPLSYVGENGSGVALWDPQTSSLLRGRFEPWDHQSHIVRLREGWGKFVTETRTLTNFL
ncbi:MAG: hypothetical protein FWG81_10675 [Betaproteobacteria bacterium]|nr:hypothetical protein [Betaproteobacteria bacterium]